MTESGSGEFAEIEKRLGGRVGVSALDLGSGRALEYRASERFPMCSTFKLPLVAAVLARVDAGKESLQRRMPYGESSLLEHAPVTREHVAEGSMSIEALCGAAITVSDNTAANLLLDTIGGPAGLTAYFRSQGDALTRLDRPEPELGTALPGDERDTTTPHAMRYLLGRITLESAVGPESRARIVQWMQAVTTGLTRVRGALPGSFVAADKTGTGENGASADVVIAWPPRRAPLLIAAYTHGSSAPMEARNAALAAAGAVVVRALYGQTP